jgi:hypothetical protein
MECFRQVFELFKMICQSSYVPATGVDTFIVSGFYCWKWAKILLILPKNVGIFAQKCWYFCPKMLVFLTKNIGNFARNFGNFDR